MMANIVSDDSVIQQISTSILATKIVAAGAPRQAAWESAFCYRALGGIGIEFQVDRQGPSVFSLVWRPTLPMCPITYKNTNGIEVKMHLVDALQRLRVDTNLFVAEYRKLHGKKENMAAMIDLSIRCLSEHLDTLNLNLAKLFP